MECNRTDTIIVPFHKGGKETMDPGTMLASQNGHSSGVKAVFGTTCRASGRQSGECDLCIPGTYAEESSRRTPPAAAAQCSARGAYASLWLSWGARSPRLLHESNSDQRASPRPADSLTRAVASPLRQDAPSKGRAGRVHHAFMCAHPDQNSDTAAGPEVVTPCAPAQGDRAPELTAIAF